MSGVTFAQVTKSYGDVVAVDSLSLEILDGEFMVFLGPSGCGKSTALRMIAGLEEISSGMLSIGDRVVNHVPPKERDIAMVFQSYALYPNMTVEGNIAFAMKLRKTDKEQIKRKVAEVAELLELTPVLDRKPGQLSGGHLLRIPDHGNQQTARSSHRDTEVDRVPGVHLRSVGPVDPRGVEDPVVAERQHQHPHRQRERSHAQRVPQLDQPGAVDVDDGVRIRNLIA